MSDPTGARLAMIPARGGSKRLPGKNLRVVDGHPLLAYSVRAALDSGCFERVVVSSDDPEVLRVAERYGAGIVARPPALAGDDAGLVPVCEHTLDAEAEAGRSYAVLALLMPNCPLRGKDIVRSAVAAFEAGNSESQVSVTPYHWHYPHWALGKRDGSTVFHFGRDYLVRSQELPHLTCPTGAIWLARPRALRRTRDFYAPGFTTFEVPWEEAIDIDEQADWEQFLTIRAGLLARGRAVPSAEVPE